MTSEDTTTLYSLAGSKAAAADGPEAAMRGILSVIFERMGDRQAHLLPDALADGQTQCFVSRAFLITPDCAYHMLVGNLGFPAEQERLMIPIEGGHPGHVVRTGEPLILTDTQAEGGFRQYLKTSRMGSAMYAPIIWQGKVLGQIVMAAQACWTMRTTDLDILVGCSHLTAAALIAHDGPRWLASIHPPKRVSV